MEGRIDEDLLTQVKETGGMRYRLWEPASPLVVLGRSSSPEREIRQEHCKTDRFPVIRRRGGGKTVLLLPGMLVISLAAATAVYQGHLFYAHAINQLIIRALEHFGVKEIVTRGISDLALGDRKILGCCLYITLARSRRIILYQGSLLFDLDLGRMGRYLQYPPWEPDYRRGRPHPEFMTTLADQGYPLPIMQVASHLARIFDRELPEILSSVEGKE